MRILLIIILFYSHFSCAQRYGSTSTPITADQPPTISACTGTMYQGTCYPGGDVDSDGATDSLEKAKGTDPLKGDTDSDGANDLCEILKETIPTDPNSKPSDCKFSATNSETNLDPIMKATCSLYQSQKSEHEWFEENIKTEKKCKTVTSTEKNGEVKTKNICEDIVVGSSSAVGAQNLGDSEEAELITMTVKVKWGVSYKDVLMISNGVMSIRPWFMYYHDYVEDWAEDDRQFDHHLGDLPSTGYFCPDEIKNKAIVSVEINGNNSKMEWLHPAFMPFKIPQYEKAYPFSFDGFQEENKDKDNIDFLGGVMNNFSYKTYIVSVQVINDSRGADDNDSDNNCDDDFDSDDDNPKCKQRNGLCETREVTFTYDFYKIKTKEDDSVELDYSEIENICKDIK